jgi:hypothetical protein
MSKRKERIECEASTMAREAVEERQDGSLTQIIIVKLGFVNPETTWNSVFVLSTCTSTRSDYLPNITQPSQFVTLVVTFLRRMYDTMLIKINIA